jgi:hypothetical protein
VGSDDPTAQILFSSHLLTPINFYSPTAIGIFPNCGSFSFLLCFLSSRSRYMLHNTLVPIVCHCVKGD